MPSADGKPKILKLSPSRLNTFRECPRCFWMDMHGKGPPGAPFPSLPGGIDLIVKAYYDKHRKEGLPPLLKGKLGHRLVDAALAASIVKKTLSWTDPETGAILHGKMDDCLCDKDVLIVMDNKTRGFPLKEEQDEAAKALEDIYRFQLETYAFILSKLGHRVADFGYLIYYIPERSDEITKGITFYAEPKKIVLKPGRVLPVFRKAIEVASKARPPAHHKECEMCAWVKGMV
jgi:hypothetical protein